VSDHFFARVSVCGECFPEEPDKARKKHVFQVIVEQSHQFGKLAKRHRILT
jgi:hypothetical protein